MTDVAALADRLHADAIAAPLRLPPMFLEHRLTVTLAEVEEYAVACGAIYAECLRAPIELVQQGWEDARSRWVTYASGLTSSEPGAAEAQQRVVGITYLAVRSLLQPGGRETILSVDRAEPVREILRWRFVSLALPSSILTAALPGRTGPASSSLRLLHPSMASDGPLAHQHLHHAAMLSFEELWVSLRLRALLEPADFRRSLRDKLAWCPGLHNAPCLRTQEHGREQAKKHSIESAKHMEEWGDLLFNAFIARGLLDRHAGHYPVMLDDCDHEACKIGLAALRGFMKGRGRPYSFTGTLYPWPNDRFRLGRHYWDAHAKGVFRHSQKKRTTFIRAQTADERSILARAFAYVRPEEDEAHDPKYEILFLQYLRVKTALHRLLVHPTGEHGLEKFLTHFSQIKIYEPRSDRLRPGKPDEPGLTVAATEYRVAPDAWLAQLGRSERDHRGKKRTIEELFPGEKAGEAAWLIHFKRKQHSKELLPLHGRAIREMEEEARRIGNALEQKPERLKQLRGIDICGVEEQQPLWVCAETLRKLRDRSSAIAGRRPGLKLQPLRLTLHAGEDFEWLTSGMRAVAEPFHWKLIERGDRIGHGIAVTLDPAEWWRKRAGTTLIKVKRIDRLLDLAFLAVYTEALAHGGRDVHERRLARGRSWMQERWLGARVEEAVRALGLPTPENISRPELVQHAKLFWSEIAGALGRRIRASNNRPGPGARLYEQWLYSYLWNRSVQERAEADDKKTELRIGSPRSIECTLLTKARLRLIRELARWQIPIESNPSSNLVVASLDAMSSQDFLAQTVEEARKAGNETLPWTISTDDPITFATSLADEYAYAWAGMVLREEDPYDPAHARALLDQAAATSMRTRFTVPDDDG